MIWINGKAEPDQALILDDGFWFGRGVFETIRVGGKPLFWTAHLDRLNQGLACLGIRAPLDADQLLRQVKALPIRHCILKVVATPENIILQTRPLPDEQNKPWQLALSEEPRSANPRLLACKSLNYLDNLLAWEDAKAKGFDDALWLNGAGEVTETSRANLFWIKQGRIRTPDLSCGLLNGIIRQWVMAHTDVQQGCFSLDDLLAAEAVFLTNSIMGIRPVAAIGQCQFGLSAKIDDIRHRYQAFLASADQEEQGV